MAQYDGNRLVQYHGYWVVHYDGNSLVHIVGNSTAEIENQGATLNINNIVANSNIASGEAKFSFKSLKLNDDELPENAKVTLELGNKKNRRIE